MCVCICFSCTYLVFCAVFLSISVLHFLFIFVTRCFSLLQDAETLVIGILNIGNITFEAMGTWGVVSGVMCVGQRWCRHLSCLPVVPLFSLWCLGYFHFYIFSNRMKQFLFGTFLTVTCRCLPTTDSSDATELKGVRYLMEAAKLLDIDCIELCNALQTSTTVTRGEKITRMLSKEQAEDARDAAAKALYNTLFAYLVARINDSLEPTQDVEWLEVGVLDIFGFENFQVNSFEQLMINVANEQLQYYFNQHIFAWELQELKAEGIDILNVTFVDNKGLLNLFLQRPVGIFAIIDEESFFPRATDLTLTEKCHKNFKKNKAMYIVPKAGKDLTFTICHYAGDITYSTPGFLEKNRDTLSASIQEIFLSSALFCRFVEVVEVASQKPGAKTGATQFLGQGITKTGHRSKNVRAKRGGPPPTSHGRGGNQSDGDDAIEEANSSLASVQRGMSKRKGRPSMKKAKGRNKGGAVGAGAKQGKKKESVGAAFKTSLADLMTKMMSATPHFVRCIKPNMQQAPDTFIDEFVLKQMKYTGVCETVRIRRDGYPVRLEFDEFVMRYKLMAFSATREIPSVDACAACVKILAACGIEVRGNSATNNWEIGSLYKSLPLFTMAPKKS